MNNDFALGLPSKSGYDQISQSGRTRLVIQKHIADKAGKHYDMRLHDKNGKAHSWVIKSLPGEKDRILAIRQPTHRTSYSNFEGTIESGYGKGTVNKVYDKKVNVISASDDRIKIRLPEGTFTMIKPKSFGKGDKNWLMIKSSAYIDELEKIAAIHPLIKGTLGYMAGLGAIASPMVIANHYNQPAMNNLPSVMEHGNVDARAIIKKHDQSVIPLTSKSQLDTAHISTLNKNIIRSQINKKGKFKNSYFVPGTFRQRYIVTPEKTDSSVIGHELGHARHYQDSVITPSVSRTQEHKKWNKFDVIKREELANKFSPIKPANYNKITGPLLNTYKTNRTAAKVSRGIFAGEMATGLGLLGAGIIKHIRRR